MEFIYFLEGRNHLAPGGNGSNRNAVTAVLDNNNVMTILNRTLTKIGTDRIWFRDTKTGEEYVYPCDRVKGGLIWDTVHTGYWAGVCLE